MRISLKREQKDKYNKPHTYYLEQELVLKKIRNLVK